MVVTAMRLGAFCAAAMLGCLAWAAEGQVAEGQTRLSLAEMEKAYIEAVEADGDAFEDQNYQSYNKPFNTEIFDRRLGCMRSDASGNFRRGWTLSDDFGHHLSVGKSGYRFKDRFLVLHGYRAHSAVEKAMWILDVQTKRVVPVLLHAFPWVYRYREGSRTGGFHWYVSAFLTPDMPLEMALAIEPVVEDWLRTRIDLAAVCEYADVPCPQSIRFYALQCE